MTRESVSYILVLRCQLSNVQLCKKYRGGPPQEQNQILALRFPASFKMSLPSRNVQVSVGKILKDHLKIIKIGKFGWQKL